MVSGLIRNQLSDRENAEKNADFSAGAENVQRICKDLAAVAAAWPTLGEPIKAGILALVNASR